MAHKAKIRKLTTFDNKMRNKEIGYGKNRSRHQEPAKPDWNLKTGQEIVDYVTKYGGEVSFKTVNGIVSDVHINSPKTSRKQGE